MWKKHYVQNAVRMWKGLSNGVIAVVQNCIRKKHCFLE